MMRTPLLLLLVLATACKSNPHSAEQAPPAAKSVATGSGSALGSDGPVLPDPVGAPGTQDLAGLSNALEQVQKEAQARHPVTITVEKVYDALAAAGIKLTGWKQVLAYNVGANYCALGKLIAPSGSQKGVVVCEYATADDAKSAVARLAKDPRFPAVSMKRDAKAETTVGVINDLDNTLQKQVFDVFETL